MDARSVSSAALVRWSSRLRKVGFLKNPMIAIQESNRQILSNKKSVQSLFIYLHVPRRLASISTGHVHANQVTTLVIVAAAVATG